MTSSMTAFARESGASELGAIVVELRSVNHRYLDCHFKLSEDLRFLESTLRERLGRRLQRGKVDCMLRLQLDEATGGPVEIDTARLQSVLAACDVVQQQMPGASPPGVLDLLQFPGVSRGSRPSLDTVQVQALDTFDRALDTLVATREREGEALRQFIEQRLDSIEREVATVRDQLPELLAQQRSRLEQRIAELGVEHDADRLEQEIVYLAQKSDVDEELHRLATHVTEVRRTLKKGGACGRRLDFLMQELNREANTLSAKALAGSVTSGAIELKVLIEQMREQVQNVE